MFTISCAVFNLWSNKKHGTDHKSNFLFQVRVQVYDCLITLKALRATGKEMYGFPAR